MYDIARLPSEERDETDSEPIRKALAALVEEVEQALD